MSVCIYSIANVFQVHLNEQATSATKTLTQALDKHRKHVSDSLASGTSLGSDAGVPSAY